MFNDLDIRFKFAVDEQSLHVRARYGDGVYVRIRRVAHLVEPAYVA